MENLSNGMKILLYVVLMFSTLLAGFLMSRGGKPYGTLVFTLHKLLAIGGLVFMILLLSAYLKDTQGNGFILTLIIIGGLSFAGILVSGGMMSLDKQQHIMEILHKASTVGYVTATAVLLWKIVST